MTARGMPTSAHSRHSDRVAVVDALVGGDHEQRAVGGAQAGPQLADEVGVPGGVDQVDLDAVVDQRARRPARSSARGRARTPRSRTPWCRSRTVPARGRLPPRRAASRPVWSCRSHPAPPRRRFGSGPGCSPPDPGPLVSVSFPCPPSPRTSCSDPRGNSSSRAAHKGYPGTRSRDYPVA